MNKTGLIFTIDTEFSTHKDDLGIFGKISGKSYGLEKFLELFERYGIKATFFIDVYAVKKQFQNEFMAICQKLLKSGHDLQLHTPNGMFDNKRGCMKEYSLDEQIGIIARGKEIFKVWFGIVPVAHRAGDWGADYNTLEALKTNNFVADCSMFYGWPQCGLNSPVLTKNKPVDYKGVLEIPATIFGCAGIGIFNPYRLLSTDSNTYLEVKYVVDKMVQMGFPVISTVYHSFSFLKWNSARTKYWVNSNRIKKFEDFLKDVVSNNNLTVKTAGQVCKEYLQDKNRLLNGPEKVFSTGLGASFLRILDRMA